MTRRAHNRAGFTLVEMLMTATLLAIVGGLAISFFLSTLEARTKAQNRIETQENARLALNRMAYEIRRARGVEATTDFGVNLAAVAGSTLDLDMADAADDPTTFDVVDGVLRVTRGAGSPVALTTDDLVVTDLTLADRSSANGRSENVALTLTLEDPAGAGGEFGASVTVSTTIELRGN